MTRYFMTIPEAAALVVQAAAIEEGPEVLVLDMGEPVRIVELAERFVRLSGFEPVMDGADASAAHDRATMPIVFTGIRPGEKLYEELAHEAEELRPTPVPGVMAWAGATPSRARVAAMVEDLSSIGTTQSDEEVIGAIDRHVRRLTRPVAEQEIEIRDAEPRMRVGSHAA
jgi:FlaA1/EpsC-like NDP-sugar epimerase